MHQSGGLLLPPVQTLVATTIFCKAKNANESPAGHMAQAVEQVRHMAQAIEQVCHMAQAIEQTAQMTQV